MSSFREDLEKRLRNKEFFDEYKNTRLEYEVMRLFAKLRAERNLTQEDLSKITGIDQADISKLETGRKKVTLNMLRKIADAFDMVLKISFKPKSEVVGMVQMSENAGASSATTIPNNITLIRDYISKFPKKQTWSDNKYVVYSEYEVNRL